MPSIDIKLGGTYVGEWSFDQAPQQLVAQRTTEGFRVTIPSTLTLRLDETYKLWPLVSALRARVQANVQAPVDLGVATDPAWYTGGIPSSELNVYLEWRGTIATLQQFERIRNGGPVKLVLDCHGEVCHLASKEGKWPRFRSEPELIHGTAYVTYAKETWVAMLNQLNAMSNVLVEFPLRPSPPSPWDDVWQALNDARNYFEQGGSTGWQGCVRSVRHALELWRSIEAEQHGPGWKAPSDADRKSRTKEERLGNLRWDLLQSAHLGPHSHADDWTRDDAVLLLATLTGLLAVRDP